MVLGLGLAELFHELAGSLNPKSGLFLLVPVPTYTELGDLRKEIQHAITTQPIPFLKTSLYTKLICIVFNIYRTAILIS